MASLFEEDIHSSDSEDDDYVPDGEVTSEDDDENPFPPGEENDEIQTKKKARKNRKEPDAEDAKVKLTEETSPPVDEKQRADDLFKSFLEEVRVEMEMKESNIKPPDGDSAYVSPEVLKTPDSGSKNNEKSPSCELFEFAGETVVVPAENCSIKSSSEVYSGCETEKNRESNKPAVAKPKGLQSVLNAIKTNKTKLNTLQKTSLDWSQFKKEHGIEEELESYNKGRGGYIERKRFLERSDLRSYEIERDMRMAKRKKNS